MDPPGFHLIPLPYMDDIRPSQDDDVTMTDAAGGTEEEMNATQTLIKSLTLSEEYSTLDVSNPHLQRHFAIVEVMPSL